ncbi:MAG: autotransporter assembly complex protein TamA [Gammaproteobacteria bacterium]|nr:autotransporter assembly complex protein TamA [Gammaproteobacteria bacterium]
MQSWSRIASLHRQLCCLAFFLLVIESQPRAELRVDGVSDELARNVVSYVSLASEPCDAEPWLIRRRYRAIASEARSALEPFGYYDAVVETTLEQDERCWLATINIDPGQPVLLRNVDVSLSTAPGDEQNFVDIVSSTALVRGAQLRQSDYESLKESLQIRAAERGYIDANFLQHKIEVWPAERVADVTLNFESGPRYSFGEITQEQDFLDASVIDAYLDFRTGMPYDNRLVTKAYSDLSVSGYFGRIEVLPDYELAKDGQIPVRVLLEPADRIEYTVGLGFSTDTGPRARAGYYNRRVNKHGNRFKTDISLSPVIQGIAAEYRKPLTDPRSEWLSYSSALTSEETDTFNNDTARVGVRRTKKVRTNWIRTLSLDLSYDEFDVGLESSSSRLVLPGIAYDHKRADRDVFPTRGRRLTFELRGTGQFLGSETSFLQATTSLRLVHSISDESRLLARAALGFTAKSELFELPPSVRFFAGGDESVRGFGYNTLGPEDELGNVVGGSHLLVASVEYERHMRGNFYGAVFVDAGNAFDGFDVDPAVGAGVGLKWQSPVGPLRFYLAHPLNKSDRTVRLHIRLGADL